MSRFLDRRRIEWLFIDWFGVLSRNFYWCVQSKKDPAIKEWCSSIFNDNKLLNDWMRGHHDLTSLTEFKTKVNEEFVLKRFLTDMPYYKPDFELLDALSSLFPNAKKALVTDNMSIFQHIIEEFELQPRFNKMYLSYETGLLKNDEPNSLFDFILADLHLEDFQNSLLIDDHQGNCQNFKLKGGRTMLIS